MSKTLRLRNAPVKNVSLSVIEFILIGVSSEHVSHVHISYVEVPEILLDGLSVEMGCIPAVWAGSHVHDHLDAIVIQ